MSERPVRSRRLRSALSYAIVLAAGVVALLAILARGRGLLPAAAAPDTPPVGGLPVPNLLTLLVQIALILALSRTVGWLFRADAAVHAPGLRSAA